MRVTATFLLIVLGISAPATAAIRCYGGALSDYGPSLELRAKLKLGPSTLRGTV